MSELRTGKALILATKPFETESLARSWLELGLSFLVYFGFLSLVFVSDIAVVQVVAALVAGVVQFRFFAIFHDHVHGALFTRSPIGHRMMTVLGLLMLIPRAAWKETHSFHHQQNGKLKWASIGSYPIMTTEQLTLATPAQRRKYFFLRHPLSIVFGYVMVGIRGMCIQAFLRAPKRHWGGPLALALHLAVFVGLSLWLGPWLAALLWVIPVMGNHAFSAYLFYAQHNFPETRFFEAGKWDYTSAALHGSSFLEMNPVMHWLSANIGYHHVHHLNHKIPFYRLPEAMAALEELQSPRHTSFRPKDIAACLRLSHWDPGVQRMQSGIPAAPSVVAVAANEEAG